MTIRVEWDDFEPGILNFTLSGDWTWAQLCAAVDEAVMMAQDVPFYVATILHIPDGLRVPGDSLFLPENLKPVNRLLDRNKARQAPVIVVGADRDTRILYDCLRMMDKRAGWQVYFTDTLDEARHYLGEHYLCAHAQPA